MKGALGISIFIPVEHALGLGHTGAQVAALDVNEGRAVGPRVLALNHGGAGLDPDIRHLARRDARIGLLSAHWTSGNR